MRIGSIEQGKRNMESDARKWLHWYLTLDFFSNKLEGEKLCFSMLKTTPIIIFSNI